MIVRVASVPSDHVYVRHLSPPDDPGPVVRLADPAPSRRVRGAPWWPPRVLRPEWLQAHADEVDLVHVHFGFDAEAPEALRHWVQTLRDLGKPLVLTVHDLRNPHHEQPELHDAQLEVLVGAAATVITLTPGAAAALRDRFGRAALVLPHPHVVPLAELSRPRPAHDDVVVGIHCKSLRAGMDPLPVVVTAARALAAMPNTRLRVDIHTDAMTPGSRAHDPALAVRLRDLAARGALELSVHDYFSDQELFDYLAGLDVSVLPYRFGTHSGWLEACHDLGTTVIAPDCGYYAEQRPCLTYRHGDAGALGAALRLAVEDGVRWRASPAARLAERRALAVAHEEIYLAVLGREVTCTS